MAYARLQPLDDTTQYAFMNGQDPSPSRDTYKTFAQVLSEVNALGFNSCVIDSDYNNGRDCYYTVSCFNLPDTLTEYHISNNEYMGVQYADNRLFIENFSAFISTAVSSYYYNYSHNLQSSGFSNLGTLFNYSNSKDNISYRSGNNPGGNVSYGYVFLTSVSVPLYINGALPVTYQWSSVPAISGKNGILSLSTADNSYHTGSDVSNIPLSDVSLTDPSKLSSLGANLPVGGTIDAIYAGSIDHINVTRTSLVAITLDIILAGQSIFTGSFLPSDYLGFLIDEENEVAVMVGYRPHVEADIITGYDERVYSATAEEMNDIYRFLHPHIDGEDPETNEPDEGTDPDFQPDIGVTGITKPSYGAIDTGFTKMYRVSDTQLKALASYLWTSDFATNVKKFFSDPREIIVGLAIMPVIPETGTAETISAGGISTGISGLPLTDQYKFNTEDTTGYAEVKAEKGNFLDYNPYTKVTAHLPFVGSHSLDVNDVMGKNLTLKYIFDFLTGSCVAEIDVNGKPRYFFGGSCGIQVPTSSEDFSRMYSGIISAGASIGTLMSSIAGGGLTAPLAIGTAANLLTNAMNSSPTVEYTSGSGSTNGMIGCKTAFITLEKPKEKVAGEQSKFTGKPSYIKRKLKSCAGYTKCFSVHLDNVPCTGQERSELERLLTAGVRIGTNGSTTPSYTPSEPGMHGIIFMKLWSDMDVIGKTWSNTTEMIEGKLMFDQSMLKPKFIVDGNFSAYNYAYIPEFGRFYFIMEQSIKTGTLSEIDMQVDVLQSFKDHLVGEDSDVDAIIERQQSLNNAYFADGMYWTQTNKEVKTYPFTFANGNEMKFDIPSDNFILTIAGGD